MEEHLSPTRRVEQDDWDAPDLESWSRRIDAMARGLEACGVRIEEDEDTLIVHGMGAGGMPGGATCQTHLDHRIAMSFLVAGMASKREITVDDGSPIVTSFPIFEGLMNGLGAAIRRG